MSIIWLIMRGDPVTQEFLTAVTASQVCSCATDNSTVVDEAAASTGSIAVDCTEQHV